MGHGDQDVTAAIATGVRLADSHAMKVAVRWISDVNLDAAAGWFSMY
ncbi:hypothetical protein ACERK3_08450 [Phycisphaerales bacterium AB-hyl4]|uniref:Uncharacterized protein n=1 Tax=Natronomicrosphaera hydrolytica TaxID=3242702 RepID=A0ABV4U413_9BACT